MKRTAILVLVAGALAQSDAEEIGYPNPGPDFRQPVGENAKILQGNGGAFSHTDVWGRYAWDYGVLPGTPVVAARDGVVISVRDDSNVGGPDRQRFWSEGNAVYVDHRDGTKTTYLHLQRDSVPVRKGDWVLQGERIGLSGDTGYAGVPHLHYTLSDKRTGHSKASKFADFARHDGVPKEGDMVEAARPPRLPQDRIDAYRKALRSSERATKAAHAALAWRLAAVVVREKDGGFHLARLLARRKARARKDLVADLEACLREAEPGDRALSRCERLIAVLHGVRDEEIAALAARLQEKVAGADEGKRWRIARRQARFWVDGLRAVHEGEADRARALLAKAARPNTVVKPFAEADLRGVFDAWTKELRRRLERTKREAAICTSLHKKRVLEDAERWAAGAKTLRKLRGKSFPKEKDAARKEYEELIALRDAALAALRANRG